MLIILQLKEKSPGRERREKAVLGKGESRRRGTEVQMSRYIRKVIV